MTKTFRELNLHPDVLAAIEGLGFETPTPIQQQAIPFLVEGGDLIGKAETGTGKTLAFSAPIIGKLDPDRVAVQALILCPTRELAQQVEEVTTALGAGRGLRSVLVVGGIHQGQQILKLREGAQIVVGTPGRILDFLTDGRIRLGYAHFVVLDEADRMLDMGFIDDVSKILEHTPEDRQMMMFSATVPPRLQRLSSRFMKDPETISTTTGIATVPKIDQYRVSLHPGDKEGFILDMLDAYPDDTCIIFCNTRREVIELDRTLWGMGYAAGSLHGDHEQEQRFRMLEAFKKGEIQTLVATDVAARGLDVDDVNRVVNFDVPEEVETYVHRIGRTGRAGGEGESITLVAKKEEGYWDRIEETTGFDIQPYEWTVTRPRKKVQEERPASFRNRYAGYIPPKESEMDPPKRPARSSGRGRSERSGSGRGGSGSSSGGSRRGRGGGRRTEGEGRSSSEGEVRERSRRPARGEGRERSRRTEGEGRERAAGERSEAATAAGEPAGLAKKKRRRRRRKPSSGGEGGSPMDGPRPERKPRGEAGAGDDRRREGSSREGARGEGGGEGATKRKRPRRRRRRKGPAPSSD